MNALQQQFDAQDFGHDYHLVDGVEMNELHGGQFQIPPPVIKRQIQVGQFVELRIDSSRFSMHKEDAAKCECPSCKGELSNPILRHQTPNTLEPMPESEFPARGWGEDFWVRITDRADDYFSADVDNHLCESRFHGLKLGAKLAFHSNHILAVHGIHRQEIVMGMSPTELKELAAWLDRNNNR